METPVRNRAALVAAAILFVAFFEGRSLAGTLVVPKAQKSLEGDTNQDIPFDIAFCHFESMRYQQVYSASEFTGLPKPMLITEIAFRPDADRPDLPGWGEPFEDVAQEVQISMSTTEVGTNALSTTFDANLGKDETVVYEGKLVLSSKYSGPAEGPKEFDVRIKLQTPFLYDPEKGNLLLDVRNFGGGVTTAFDAVTGIGDSVSRVYTYGESVLSPIGWSDGTYSIGLVTEFTYGESPVSDSVSLDIKPGACPNPFNVAAQGVLPAAIAGTEGLDVTQIDPSSLRLAGVAPLRWSLEDVTTPYMPFIGRNLASDCTSQGPDGRLDLALKFDMQKLVTAIRMTLGRQPNDAEVLILLLGGNLLEEFGGSPIQGEDSILIQNNKRK